MSHKRTEAGRIYQRNPPYSQPSQFKAKGWCATVEGYIYEAKKLTMCILRNRHYMQRAYAWALHVNLNVELPPKTVTDLWTKACRTLRRRGVVALWVREPNKANKVHYHIVVKNPIGEGELEQALEEAMPPRSVVPWRKRVEPIRNERYFCHYLTKAKIAGSIKGRTVEDLYGRKRLLLKANLKLKKYGVIGDFWEPGKSKEKLWDEIKAKEKRIAEGLDEPGVRKLVGHVYELLGRTVPLRVIERAFGYHADSEPVKRWIEQLIAEDSEEHEAIST